MLFNTDPKLYGSPIIINRYGMVYFQDGLNDCVGRFANCDIALGSFSNSGWNVTKTEAGLVYMEKNRPRL